MSVNYSIDAIVKAVQQIKRQYDETDPFRLVKAMGIHLALRPMGTEEGCCKGFFIVHKRIRHITINSDLPLIMQRIILAHEIGHAVLHTKSGALAHFHDMLLFDSDDTIEYEANLFASELLLQDEDVMEALNSDCYFSQVAVSLYVPEEMLDFKFRVMKRKGFALNAPYTAKNNFLKDFEKNIPYCTDE